MENVRDISMVISRPNLLCYIVHLCSYLSYNSYNIIMSIIRMYNIIIYFYVLSLGREALCTTVTIL